MENLNINGLARELARHTVFIRRSQSSLTLSVAPKHDKLIQKRAVETLELEISNFFGRKIQLSVDVAEHNDTTLSLSEQTLADELEAQKNAEIKVQKDPTILALSEKFDAVITMVTRKK